MSKKKSTTSTKNTTSAAKVSTIVTEEVKDTATVEAKATTDVTTAKTKVEETPVTTEESKLEETPVLETVTEEPVETPVVPEVQKTVEETTVKVLSDEEQLTPVTENKSGKREITGSKDDVQLELCKKYTVKFAQSYFMKICAAVKQFSLFSIIETWMINRTAFIGLTSMDDFNHIKEVMEGNIITYKYKVISDSAKQDFLEKLKFNTNYVISHK